MGSEDPSSTYLYLLAYTAHEETAHSRLVAEIAFLAILALPISLEIIARFDLRFIVWVWTVYIKIHLLLF
jgi:hypothetical protein